MRICRNFHWSLIFFNRKEHSIHCHLTQLEFRRIILKVIFFSWINPKRNGLSKKWYQNKIKDVWVSWKWFALAFKTKQEEQQLCGTISFHFIECSSFTIFGLTVRSLTNYLLSKKKLLWLDGHLHVFHSFDFWPLFYLIFCLI